MRALLPAILLSIAVIAPVGASELLDQVPLAERIAEASLIVEGRVLSSRGFWDEAHSNIHTLHEVEVYRRLSDAERGTRVGVVTAGGSVGLDFERVVPSLALRPGDVGVFLLQAPRALVPSSQTDLPSYSAVAGPQGFVRYDESTGGARDAFASYDIAALRERIARATGVEPTVLLPFAVGGAAVLSGLGSALISSIFPTTITAGTGSLLTINGSGFGSSPGTVGFSDANSGGFSFYEALATQVVSWSNTQIVVEVPDRAGTGPIRVTPVSSPSAFSPGSLTVDWAVINVEYDAGTGEFAYPARLQNTDGAGGYVFRYYTDFAATGAPAAFERAIDSWVCGTGVAWQIGATTVIDAAASDGINVVRFDNGAELPNGVLGRATSRYSGCFTGGDPLINWFLSEVDVVFDDAVNWNLSSGPPSFSEYDFESVAVHELGHGHQMGHVIDTSVVMHYALSNGEQQRDLSGHDLDAGTHVLASSAVGVCGGAGMSAGICADWTATPTATATETPTHTASHTPTPTFTATFTPSPTDTPTHTFTPSSTSTRTPTSTLTATPTETNTPTRTPTPTLTATPTDSDTATPTLTATAAPSDTPTATATRSDTQTATATPSDTPTATWTQTATPSDTAAATPTSTQPPTFTATDTPTATSTPTHTSTFTRTPTRTLTPTDTASPTFPSTHTPTRVPTDTPTHTLTPTRTATAAPTDTASPTFTSTHTPTLVPTDTATRTRTPTATPTDTASATSTSTHVPTVVPPDTPTATFSPAQPDTPTATVAATATPTATATATFVDTATRTAEPTEPAPTATATAAPTSTVTPAGLGCAAEPRSGCVAATGKTLLLLQRRPQPSQNSLKLLWQGPIAGDGVGVPTDATGFDVCLYGTGDAVKRLAVPAEDRSCGRDGVSACWKSLRGERGYRYRDRSRADDGIARVLIRTGDDGEGLVKLIAKGDNLRAARSLPDTLPLAAQTLQVQILRADAPELCWQATFAPPLQRNTTDQLKAVATTPSR